MERLSNSINNFFNVMDQNIRGVQIGCYSVALVGLTIALRKVRPFSKFKRPSDIPNHFIEEKRELFGVVTRIDPSGGLLMVQHKPLVNVFLVPSGQLPVKIFGVKLSGLGLNWLQAVVAGQQVTFIPVSKEKDFVQCQVLFLEETKDKKSQPILKTVNLGEQLLKIGFATREEIPKPLSDDSKYLKYYRLLESAEHFALRKQLGMKYYIKPTKQFIWFLLEKLSALSILSSKELAKLPSRVQKLYTL